MAKDRSAICPGEAMTAPDGSTSCTGLRITDPGVAEPYSISVNLAVPKSASGSTWPVAPEVGASSTHSAEVPVPS